MTPEEWRATPWFIKRAYVNGLQDEGILKGNNEYPSSSGVEARSVDPSEMDWENDPLNASDAAYEAMGLTVVDSNKVYPRKR